MRSTNGRRVNIVFLRATAVFLLLLAACLLFGGGWLLGLGGSPYYFLSGLLLLGGGTCLWRRSVAGMWLYGLFLTLTLGWAIWESGPDGWALVPRIAAPLVVGLWLVMPWVRRGLAGGRLFRGISGVAVFGVGAALSIVLGALLHRPGPMDPIHRTGSTTFTAGAGWQGGAATQADWQHYGGDRGGTRYSGLGQLTPANVTKLEPVWQYRVGPVSDGGNYSLQVTPLKIDRALYLCTVDNNIISLDAETGRERWRFDPRADLSGTSGAITCRGVAYHKQDDATGMCAERIITNTIDARLIAVDAHSGAPCPDFGDHGQVSLLRGMGDVEKGYYYVSSAPTIVRGRIILGGWVSDGQYWGEPSGVIRAYDAVTGAFSWAFDMGRPDRQTEPENGETYTRSTPNSWAPMSADEELGLVYAPTGNATPDYFGGQRRDFDDRFSTAVVAIDAETGQLRWSFQTVHHDLWDYDVASQPGLVDIPQADGTVRAALIQPTKRGEIFVLDRVTGEPIKAVEELPAPQSGIVPGEYLSPTQPWSVDMPSLGGPMLTEKSMWGATPLDQLWCRIEFRKSRYDGPMTPPGLQQNIVFPGYAGGSNWGSVTVDLDRGILVANALRMANRVHLIGREDADAMGLKPNTADIRGTTHAAVPQAGTPYGAVVAPFLSPLALPCINPPYSTLSAIDLQSGKLLWTQPFGTARDAGPFGISSGLRLTMGVPAVGGAITTRGGLTFIGASHDRYLRAFETATGKLLWQSRLPAGGQATPLTYVSPESGRQFVVIAAGGSAAIASRFGDYIIGYALPK